MPMMGRLIQLFRIGRLLPRKLSLNRSYLYRNLQHLLHESIDEAMYGKFAGNEALGAAEYNLSYDTKARGVYTFCMCPGGEVMAAASEQDTVVVNGMSRRARDGTPLLILQSFYQKGQKYHHNTCKKWIG